MEQVQPDETSSAAVDIACDDPVKLAEHYRDLCVRLTEQLEKAKSKAAQRKKRIQVLEDRNKELTNENAALQLKLSQYEMGNNVESNRAENENERMFPDEAMQVSTEGSADDKEVGNGRVCEVSESNWTARYKLIMSLLPSKNIMDIVMSHNLMKQTKVLAVGSATNAVNTRMESYPMCVLRSLMT